MSEQSIMNKLELLLSEISDIRNAINSNNHPDWCPSTHTLSDIPNDVESMFTGNAGLYQDAANNTAYVDFPVIPAYAFNNWGSMLQSINFKQSITSIGDYGCYNTYINWTELPSTITYIGDYSLANTKVNLSALPPNLIHLGSYPFDHSSTRSITGTLPSSLEYIGDYAFYVQYSSSPYLANFSGNIPQHLTHIGSYAFYGCTNLTVTGNIIDPNDESDTPIIVGSDAFRCGSSYTGATDTKLTIGGDTKGRLQPGSAAFCGRTNITFSGIFPKKYYDDGDTTDIPSYVFCNCNNVAFTQANLIAGNIRSYAFYNCWKINVTDSITAGAIDNYAFYGCTSMQVSDSITASSNIGNYAFYGANNITSENGIVCSHYIGAYAFYCRDPNNGGSLKPSIIQINSAWNTGSGTTAATIGELAFDSQDLTGLTNILIESSEDVNIGPSAFSNTKFQNTNLTIEHNGNGSLGFFYDQGYSYDFASFYNSGLSGITFVGNIPYINPRTFYRCRNLSSITFSPFTTHIGESAFSETNLTSITIPSTVNTIDEYAFSAAHSKSITLNASLTSCGYGAFSCNQSLASVTIGNSVVEIGDCCFEPMDSVIGGGIPLTGQIQIPSSVLRFGDFVFGRSRVSSLVFNSGIKKIGVITGGWYNHYDIGDIDSYYDLQSVYVSGGDPTVVTVPNTVEELGGFVQWHGITSFTIKSNVKKFGTFYGCDQLSSLTIEEGLEEFGIRVCVKADVNRNTRGNMDVYPLMYTQISTVILPATLKKLGPAIFSSIGTDDLNSYLTEVRIQSDCLQEPYNDGGIGSNVGLFEGNRIVNDIYLSNITKIPSRMFYGIDNSDSYVLLHWNVPNLKEIGSQAFMRAIIETNDPRTGQGSGVRGNRVIGIPKTIETIGAEAFCDIYPGFTIIFDGNPDTSKLTIAPDAFKSTLLDHKGFYVCVPWSKGDVYEGSDPTRPWGLDESCVTYNYHSS